MKVIFIGHSGFEYPHTRVRCYGFAEALRARGFETEVLSFKDHLAPERSEADMYANLRDRDKIKLVLRASARLFKERRALFYVQKALFHSAAPYLVSRLAGARYVLDYDDYDVPLSNFFHRGLWNRLFFGSHDWGRITERLAQSAVGCVVSSHFLEGYLQPFNSKVERVETGVDITKFHPPEHQRPEGMPVTFLWNGLVWGEDIFRGVVMAIEAFDKIHGQLPNSRLLIVGGGNEWERLVKIVQERYSRLPVELAGWLPSGAMPALLREADIGLLPFAVDNEWVRGKSPTKLFEYLASGLAVVATGIGEVRYVIQSGENGILADGTGEMAAGMLALGKDRAARRTMSERARETAVERYSQGVLGDRLAAFLRQFER
jgi:glycosyltransferase involved in cell wall biosynthesis